MSDKPFNIRLLNLTPDKLNLLKPVTSLDIFDNTKVNFHEDGLYSVSIFGRVGDPSRRKRFSYIDLKLKVFHPVVFKAITTLKALYGDIISGIEYAVWDSSINDFVKSNETEGNTGFNFFLQHWEKIDYTTTKSITRQEKIDLIKKYGKQVMVDKVVVLPAGLRELEYDNDRVKEDEINDYYKRLLSLSNSITKQMVDTTPVLLDKTRLNMQLSFNALYDHLMTMLEGKKKFILGKWGSRRIFNSTRNVISPMTATITKLGAKTNPNLNVTQVGLYQLAKANSPLVKYNLKTGYLASVFPAPSSPVKLINKKTLQAELLHLPNAYYDTFMTDEGLDKFLNLYSDEAIRHKPIEIEGRWLGLIYKGSDGTVKLLGSIDELPATRAKEDVSPITYAELLYFATQPTVAKSRCFVTRYPITGMGSIYPSYIELKPCIRNETRVLLADDWNPSGDESDILTNFPIRGEAFLNAFSPNTAKLKLLGADFDGDTSSFTTVYVEDSVKDIDDYLNSKRAYINTSGGFLDPVGSDLLNMILTNLTRVQV